MKINKIFFFFQKNIYKYIKIKYEAIVKGITENMLGKPQKKFFYDRAIKRGMVKGLDH